MHRRRSGIVCRQRGLHGLFSMLLELIAEYLAMAFPAVNFLRKAFDQRGVAGFDSGLKQAIPAISLMA